MCRLSGAGKLSLVLRAPKNSVSTARSLMMCLRDVFKGSVQIVVPRVTVSTNAVVSYYTGRVVVNGRSGLKPVSPRCKVCETRNVVRRFRGVGRRRMGGPLNARI